MTANEIIELLKTMGSERNRSGMARFGINTEKAFGISMAELKPIAKEIKKNHKLALELWDYEYHEARLLAVLIDNPKEVGGEQMDSWASSFNSWDLCDQACMKLFCYTEARWDKVFEWGESEVEYVKRASFALIAGLGLHEKSKDNENFIKSLELIVRKADDERNFVKKAINWALRQIGKRNMQLREAAIDACNKILTQHPNSKSAKWVANDALREFQNDKIINRTMKSRHN